MTKIIRLLFLAIVLLTISCAHVADDSSLQLTCDLSQLSKKLSDEITFKTLTIGTSKNISSAYGVSSDLDIQLTNASINFYTQARLDSLSKRLASIVKKNSVNFTKFSWVNIIYSTDNGSPISDSTDHRTYVFRQSEIK